MLRGAGRPAGASAADLGVRPTNPAAFHLLGLTKSHGFSAGSARKLFEPGQPFVRTAIRGPGFMNLWQDIRYGERMLRKSPGFAITAVLTLALGIGATTAVFSVCDSLLWKPIALPHLESLVMVLQRIPDNPNEWNSVSPADLEDVGRQSTTLENLASWDEGMANIVGAGGTPDRALQALVSANFFTTLGVQPETGRAGGRER